MKTLITPYIGKQTISFAFKEGFGRGDKLTVLIPEEKVGEGLDLKDEDLDNLRDEVENLELGLNLEKKILKTGQFEELVRDISKVFMNAEGKVIVNISSDDPAVISAFALCCSFFGGSIERIYILDKERTGFEEINFPHSEVNLKKKEKEFLKTVIRKGPKTLNELTKETGISKSTASRLSEILNEKGLITAEFTGKEKEVDSTLTGDIKAMVLHKKEEFTST